MYRFLQLIYIVSLEELHGNCCILIQKKTLAVSCTAVFAVNTSSVTWSQFLVSHRAVITFSEAVIIWSQSYGTTKTLLVSCNDGHGATKLRPPTRRYQIITFTWSDSFSDNYCSVILSGTYVLKCKFAHV